MPVALDTFDRRILAVLQENARISNLDLAERVGLSPTPCYRRVQRLEQSGVISRYVALIDPRALGLDVSVYVRVRLDQQTQHAVAEFQRAIALRSEVTECHLLTGDFDYLIRIRVENVPALKDFIVEQLLTIPGVLSTSSSVVLESPKETTALPVEPVQIEHKAHRGRRKVPR